MREDLDLSSTKSASEKRPPSFTVVASVIFGGLLLGNFKSSLSRPSVFRSTIYFTFAFFFLQILLE